MLEQFVGRRVVIDLRSPYVCLGTLKHVDDVYLELRNVDMHDLRDSESTREHYIASSRTTGIKRNRKKILLQRSEMVAISLLEDVVDG